MKITISKASPRDARGIQEVLYTVWLTTYPNRKHGISVEDIRYRFKRRLSDAYLARAAKRLETLKKNSAIFVAKDGKKVVGMIRVIKNAQRNRLMALYVLPAYQGKGIGSRFWKRCVPFLDPKKNTDLTVAIYNQKAIGFYKKLGFVDTGKRKSFTNGRLKSGALIPLMVMRLSPA